MPSTTTLFLDQALLPDGWATQVRLTLERGVITRVETDVQPDAADQRQGVGLPGMPNLHSHAFQRGMAGLAERRGESADSFWTWREVMYRFLERMEPDDVEAVAAQLQVEMLESGFTRVGEFHYLHHGIDGTPYAAPAEMASRLAAAAEISGIGLTLLPVFYAHGGFGGQAPDPGQRRFLSDPNSFARLMEASRAAVAGLPDAVVGMAPHSLRAVTGAELATILPLAADGPIHIHVAEQMAEVEACLRWTGQRPVAWLLDHAPVSERWCLIHATHMTDDEAAAMARSGAVAGLCPITEANLGDGTFNALPFLAAGGAYGIGSDFERADRSGRRVAPARIFPAPPPPRPQRAGHGRPAGHGPGAVRCGRGRRRSRTGRPGGSAPGRTGRYRDPRRGAPSPCRPQRRRATRQPGLRCREPNHP